MTNDQQRIPDEAPIYQCHITEERIAGVFTEEDIADALGALEEGGHVRAEAVYPGYERAYIPTERPVWRVELDKPVTIFSQTLIDRLLTAVEELGTATVAYGEALDRHAAAVIAAFESDATLEYHELDFRAQRYAEGVAGKNETERKANLDLAVMDDDLLSDLRAASDQRRHDKTRTGATERKCDVLQKSLRDQIAALSTLLKG